MKRSYDYPVWGTQGGGLVREVNGVYIFVEKPDCPGLDVGDEMPKEWGIAPTNNLASGIDEEGLPYSEYPDCPNCPDGGRVGRNIAKRDPEVQQMESEGWLIDDWYCYECGCTF